MIPNLLLIGGNGRWGKIYQKTLINLDVPFVIGDRNNWKKLVSSGEFQGTIISTPASTHISIAEYCLQASLPTLIEKPLSLNPNDIFPLYPYQDLPILINHTQLFTSPFQETLTQLKNKNIIEINSLGCGFGSFRSDCPPHFLIIFTIFLFLFILPHKLPKSVLLKS